MDKVGKFIGAAAYGFTHVPMIIAQKLTKRKIKKEREEALKNLSLLSKFCDELIDEGRMTINQKADVIAALIIEIVKRA